MNQLDLLVKKYNKIYKGEVKFDKKDNYFCLVQLIMGLLDVGNEDEAVLIINSYCLALPEGEGKSVLTLTALMYNHYKLFNLLNTLYEVDVNNNFVYNAIKYKADKIIDGIIDNYSSFNINFSADNYSCIQRAILECNEMEYMQVFTSIMKLFLTRAKSLAFSKARMIYNCFMKDAIVERKWYFLSFIISFYGEICMREKDGKQIMREDFNKCLQSDLLFTLDSQEEINQILKEIKEVYVLNMYLDLE